MKTRRFFAGNTLPQALMAAARYHGLAPEELAYRLCDKRHGFVTRVRRLIVEVDPAAPQRAGAESRPASVPAPAVRAATLAGATALRTPKAAPAGIAVERAEESDLPARAAKPAASPRAAGAPTAEPFLPPDEESELAASEALGRILALARLELTAKIERRPDRMVITLAGKDEALLADLGEEFLNDLEQLAPRAIRGLTGRMVRCRVEGAGLRSAREDELRRLAEIVAERVTASGKAELLDPLSSADRRIVHMALVDDPRVATESQGFGAEKRILISPAAPSRQG